MEKPKCFISFHALLLAFTLMGIGVDGCSDNHGLNGAPFQRLFVFGDSFVDTGNLPKYRENLTRCWYHPYGITFPHWPTGRFSDGRVLTDYFASFLGIKSPIPYKYRKIGSKLLPYGMNFAVGGSGVFNNQYLQKNLSCQIDAFKGQIDEGVFSKSDVSSSVALVTVAGNDYSIFLDNGGTMVDLWAFRKRLIKQLKSDLKRLHDIGVTKVVVNNVHPMGCAPELTRGSSYTECNVLYNMAAEKHNTELEAVVKELNAANHPSGFLLIDQYTAFNAIIHREKGSRKFENTLKPCCEGKTKDADCADINEQGVKQYSLCRNPEDSIYWDSSHPTQAAWRAVFEHVKPSLYKYLL